MSGGGEFSAQGVVEVVVPDLAAAMRFYRTIGFDVARDTASFVVLRWGEMFLFLAEDARATTSPRWTNIRIIVADADAVWRRIRALGVPVVSAIGDRPYGLRDFTLRDPAGFEVRFAQVLPESAGRR